MNRKERREAQQQENQGSASAEPTSAPVEQSTGKKQQMRALRNITLPSGHDYAEGTVFYCPAAYVHELVSGRAAEKL